MKKHKMLCLLGLSIVALAGICIFYLLAQHGISIGCPLYVHTGLRCPGCGNSRAAIALIEGNFITALNFNLLFPLEFGYLLRVLIKCSINYWCSNQFAYRPHHWWVDAIILGIVVLWGIIRNFLHI